MALVAIAAGITGALAAQTVPPDPGPDIVVNGAPPRMVAGQWHFQSGTILIDPVPGRPMAPPRHGEAWNRCIADGDTQAIIRQLIGEQARFEDGSGCSALRLTITRARASGSRRCTRVGAHGASYTLTRLDAHLAETRLKADYVSQASVMGSDVPRTRWQVTAVRVGDCPGSTPAPKPVAMPEPQPVPASAPRQLAIVQDDASHPEAVPAPPPSTVATTARPEDIVVIARRLRRMRLHYGVSGSLFRWCHADISSGDPRVDRIGCAMVRACVREGNDTTASALACVNRRIDSLDPVTGSLPRPVVQPAR